MKHTCSMYQSTYMKCFNFIYGQPYMWPLTYMSQYMPPYNVIWQIYWQCMWHIWCHICTTHWTICAHIYVVYMKCFNFIHLPYMTYMPYMWVPTYMWLFTYRHIGIYAIYGKCMKLKHFIYSYIPYVSSDIYGRIYYILPYICGRI